MMNNDYSMDTPCRICGHVYGYHRASTNSCPMTADMQIYMSTKFEPMNSHQYMLKPPSDPRIEVYQVLDKNGITVPVGALTLDEALTALCDAIDCIEAVDEELSTGARRIIQKWREN